ncbi:MAG: hypothetical protein EOR30_33440 [Mesorhizobium sp.]|nr:hypothetical protein EOA49_04160 [Mesorhizobium sp. M1A.F.Ca.IN.020.04.1.1]RUW16247.1 hypothetical protein EOA53_01005 [Mesorhizobium sp. M1A.F.Ca.IN.020.03.1.1]RVD13730.1 hypothetical protein EN738_33790 [Mesorhizobium sp. M4B.F.Ca.ET.017.02.2.1]RWA66323.1 MAG: hypothetical protein EOQ27_00205 [Mesorhizobium sp.]RWX59102.1 hypothetical protein EN780_35235 [Mesorhizobium sp. M4B.F.Ca.ET.089.01.1.1]TGQ09151.1 hypothetical protein EN858_20365 [Mesorhizobium sp. M4B.F.Ca.ET.215.01.1.1]TGQ2570
MLPAEIAAIAFQNKAAMYTILSKAAAETDSSSVYDGGSEIVIGNVANLHRVDLHLLLRDPLESGCPTSASAR